MFFHQKPTLLKKSGDYSGLDFTEQDLINFFSSEEPSLCFREANLSGLTIKGHDFSNADFRDADLTNTTFIGCIFSGANFKDAKTDGILFSDSDLNGVFFLNISEENLHQVRAVSDKQASPAILISKCCTRPCLGGLSKTYQTIQKLGTSILSLRFWPVLGRLLMLFGIPWFAVDRQGKNIMLSEKRWFQILVFVLVVGLISKTIFDFSPVPISGNHLFWVRVTLFYTITYGSILIHHLIKWGLRLLGKILTATLRWIARG